MLKEMRRMLESLPTTQHDQEELSNRRAKDKQLMGISTV